MIHADRIREEHLSTLREEIADLTEQRRVLDERLKTKRRERERLRGELQQAQNGKRRGGGNDFLGVASSELATHVSAWLTQEGPGGQLKLARQAGVPRRTIYRILNGKSRWTTLNIADELLSGMGNVVTVYDLTIVPNPRMSDEMRSRYTCAEAGS